MKFVTPLLFLLCATTVCTSALHVHYFEHQGRRLQLLQTPGLFEQGQGNFFPFTGPIERAPWQQMNIKQPQFSPEVFPVDNGISGGFGNVAEAAPLPATSVDEQGVNSAEATLVAAPAPVAATGDGLQPSNTVHSPKLSDSSGISMSSGSGSIVRSVGDLRKTDPSVGEETPKTKTSVALSLKSHSLAAIVTLYLMVTFMS